MSFSITAYLITHYNEDGSVSYFHDFVGKYPSFYYTPICRLYLDFQEAYSDYESLIYRLKQIMTEENREIDFNDYRIIPVTFPVTFDISDAYGEDKIGVYTYQDFLDDHTLDEHD